MLADMNSTIFTVGQPHYRKQIHRPKTMYAVTASFHFYTAMTSWVYHRTIKTTEGDNGEASFSCNLAESDGRMGIPNLWVKKSIHTFVELSSL